MGVCIPFTRARDVPLTNAIFVLFFVMPTVLLVLFDHTFAPMAWANSEMGTYVISLYIIALF